MTVQHLACDRCGSPLERDDLRCAICSRAAPPTAEDLPQPRVEVLRCRGCGAAVSYSARAQAAECAFCGSVVHVELPEDPLEQTRLFLPFTVDRGTAEASFRSWLRGLGWFRPSDLSSTSRVESLRALWWVAWLFDAEAVVSWTADSDHGARRADWAPHGGQVTLEFDNVMVSASRGLDQTEAAHLSRSYRLSSARQGPKGAGPDAVVERFDVPRSLARRTIAATIERLARERLTAGVIPGRRFRNLHSSILLSRLVTDRYALPAYVMAYRYRDSLYRFVLSGQDAARLRGEAPYSTSKILGVVVGGLAALALVALLLGLA